MSNFNLALIRFSFHGGKIMNENNNENLILKKRLSTHRSPKGSLTKIPDDLIIDTLKAWERWTGTSKDFYSSLGLKKQQIASIIKKGKRLFKEGKDTLGPFIPVEVNTPLGNNNMPIILKWDHKKSIRFYEVDQLIDFLKKAS